MTRTAFGSLHSWFESGEGALRGMPSMQRVGTGRSRRPSRSSPVQAARHVQHDPPSRLRDEIGGGVDEPESVKRYRQFLAGLAA